MRRLALALGFLVGILPLLAALAQAPPAVPALPDTERRTTYALTASTCACSVGFQLYEDGTDVDQQIEVWINGSKVLSTNATSGWTITSATGSLATIPRPITNAVLTFSAAQTGTVQIVGAQRPRRLSQFAENRGVAARDLNQVLTYLTAMEREFWDLKSRMILTLPGTSGGFISGTSLGLGNVVGPGAATDSNIVLFNGASGAIIKDAGGGIPSIPLTHPSSSNLLGAGCSVAHQAWWVDQNLCGTGDTWILNSSDPSALLTITVGGTATSGDTVALTFNFAGTCSGGPAACKVTVPVTSASTITTIAAALVSGIQANANLYNNVAGAQKQILRISNSAGTINIDYDSRVSMIVTRTVTGAATETVTVPASCAAACDKQWDVNPTLVMGRLVSGVAPPANSQLFGLVVQGGTDVSPSAFAQQYGVLALTVDNSTSGAIQSQWTVLVPDASGVINKGVHIGPGIHGAGLTSKGFDNTNFNEYWTAGVNSITRATSTWIFNATTNDKIQFITSPYSVSVNNVGFALDIASTSGPVIARLGSPGTQFGQIYLTGSTSGTVIITPQASAGTPTLTLPTSTGTLLSSADAGNLPATATNDNAVTGKLGEYISATIEGTSAVTMATGTVRTVTSTTLTGGDWDVCGVVHLSGQTSTTVTNAFASVSGTSGVILNTAEGASQIWGNSNTLFSAATYVTMPMVCRRISIAAPTSVFLLAQPVFAVGTTSAFGYLRARRNH